MNRARRPRTRPVLTSRKKIRKIGYKPTLSIVIGGTSGRMRNDPSAAKPMRTMAGMARAEVTGNSSKYVLNRTKMTNQVVRSQNTTLAHHLRHFLDEHRGEFDGGPKHPREGDHQHDGDA